MFINVKSGKSPIKREIQFFSKTKNLVLWNALHQKYLLLKTIVMIELAFLKVGV